MTLSLCKALMSSLLTNKINLIQHLFNNFLYVITTLFIAIAGMHISSCIIEIPGIGLLFPGSFCRFILLFTSIFVHHCPLLTASDCNHFDFLQQYFLTRPDTRLPQSRAGGQGPYLRSLDHLGRSSEAKNRKKKKKQGRIHGYPSRVRGGRGCN